MVAKGNEGPERRGKKKQAQRRIKYGDVLQEKRGRVFHPTEGGEALFQRQGGGGIIGFGGRENISPAEK